MRTEVYAGIVGAVVAAGVLSVAAGELPDPVFWTTQKPLGKAGEHEHIIQMVKIWASQYKAPFALKEPEDAAQKACEQISDRLSRTDDPDPLEEDQVCILIRRLGMGDGNWHSVKLHDLKTVHAPALFQHWCDALPADGNPECTDNGCWCGEACGQETPTAWNTPWMAAGILETGAWMDRFIQRYRRYQEISCFEARIPDPVRFHFDVEHRPCAMRDAGPKVFNALKDDYRWVRKGLLPGTDKSLRALFEDQKFEDGIPYPDDGWEHEEHQRWACWYESRIREFCDAAVNAACYAKVRQAWPRALCSNYDTSLRIRDGKGFYKPRNEYGGRDWVELVWWGMGDLQAPVCYPFHKKHQHQEEGETIWEATFRTVRRNINVLIDSLGKGDDPDEIVPRLSNIGQPVCCGGNDYYSMEKQDMRQMLAMLRARRIKEFIVWNGHQGGHQTVEDWEHLADVINQAWMYDIKTIRVRGQQGGDKDGKEDVEFASDEKVLVVSSKPSGARIIATFDDVDRFGAELADRSQLYVMIEAKKAGTDEKTDVSMVVYLYDWNSPKWVRIGEAQQLSRTREFEFFYIGSGHPDDADFINDKNGTVRAKVKFTGDHPFAVEIDCIQIVRGDARAD